MCHNRSLWDNGCPRHTLTAWLVQPWYSNQVYTASYLLTRSAPPSGPQVMWEPCDTVCLACSRVHDRTVSHIRYLPEEGLIASLSFDNTLRIFNATQASLRCTVLNDTGGPYTGMEHDPIRSQVQHWSCWTRIVLAVVAIVVAFVVVNCAFILYH